MRYTEAIDWESRIAGITHEPAVPIVVKRMGHGAGKLFWVPRRYRSVAALAFDGKRFTVRDFARRARYSVKGAWAALRSMAELGMGVVSSARGCRGWTRFVIQTDVQVAPQWVVDPINSTALIGNVSTTDRLYEEGERRERKDVTVEETFDERVHIATVRLVA